jgi:hypothetical protein
MDTNIRVLTDKLQNGGIRTVLIIDAEDSPINEAIMSFLAPMLAGISGAVNTATEPKPISEVKGLKPVAKETEPVPTEEDFRRMESSAAGDPDLGPTVSIGLYQGVYPAQALNKDGVKALVELFNVAKKLPDGSEKNAITSECKIFMANKLVVWVSRINARQDTIDFLDAVKGIAPVDKLANGYGFTSCRDLCNLGSDDEIKVLFDAVVTSLQERGRR